MDTQEEGSAKRAGIMLPRAKSFYYAPTVQSTPLLHGIISQCSPDQDPESVLRAYADSECLLERPRMSHTEPNAPPIGLDENYSQILKDGTGYAERPKEARAWIESFGNFASGTRVSRRLVTTGATSLLPMLASWLAQWFQRTQTARKLARLAIAQDDREKMMSMQYEGANHAEDMANADLEERNLRWLFDYIFDYLGLEQDHPLHSDLQDVCQTVVKLCQSTTSIEDIEASIRVIYGVVSKWSLPLETTDELVEVLCNIRMTLSKNLPPHLMDCIILLVTGEHGQTAMRRLLAFIQDVGVAQPDKKSIALARGSVLFLRDLVEQDEENLTSTVSFADLIKPLQAASKTETPRLCTDILELCSKMLVEARAVTAVLSHFAQFMGIVENCAIIAKAKASIRLSQPTDDHIINIDEQDPYQIANIKSERQIKEILLALWQNDKLNEESKILVYGFFLDTLENTTEEEVKFMLQYARTQKLCCLNKAQGQKERTRIIRDIVRNMRLSQELRNIAIQVVNDAELANIGSSSSQVIDSWLEQLEMEEDPKVSASLVQSLQQNFLHSSDAAYSRKIVDGLEAIIFHEDKSQNKRRALSSAVTALINIVLQSSTPNDAFNALLRIANIECKSIEARVEALRFLFRLRCDSSGVLYLQEDADSEYIASALCRTRESLDAFTVVETNEPHRKSSSSTSLSTKANSAPVGWIYPDTEHYDLSRKFTNQAVVLGRKDLASSNSPTLDTGAWLITIAECLQRDQEWETFSYLVVHAGAQLSNTTLFTGSDKLLETVSVLRRVLCERIVAGKIFKPPVHTGLKDSDVAICLFNVLTGLIPYATIKAGPIQKGFADELVKAFLSGIGGTWEGTSRSCMHALSICCLEMPTSVASYYPTIVDKMSKNMTQAHLSMHILEFLAQVARLPAVHSNFQDDEIMMIFGICIQFLERARERPTTTHLASSAPRSGTPAARQSGLSSRRPPYRAQMLIDLGLSHYNSALVFHVMIFWFLSLKLNLRARSVKWIVPRLVWKDRQGEEQVDEQSMVFIDMMQRTAYSDLGETASHPQFATADDGRISAASWVVGLSIVTVETAGHTGVTQITKRQASGTTHAVYQQYTAPMPPHHIPVDTGIRTGDDDGPAGIIEQLPSHILLQMAATAEPVALRKQPVLLPKDDVTRRAIESFDRIVTVDSHKFGVLYIGPGQSLEKDYLANTSGSPDYQAFLDGLGTRVPLAPPLRYNPQGLQNGIDGTETYAWRDRVTEIVFHIPTMMPTNLADDPGSTQKKSHVGNCHVNIIYNRSGQPWNFANFASQLNYVNIVVEPANRPSASSSSSSSPSPTPIDFFRVQTLTAPQFPPISPASDFKVLSAAQLPQFVRLLALNANVFCQAWNVRDSDTEFPSSWRARLQAIKRLREKVVSKEKGTLAQQLDFSNFTLN